MAGTAPINSASLRFLCGVSCLRDAMAKKASERRRPRRRVHELLKAMPAQWTVKCVPWLGCWRSCSSGVAKAIGVLALVSKGKCARNCIKMPTQKHKNYGHTLGTGQQQHHHTALSSALGPVISSTPAVCALQSWPGGRREPVEGVQV